MVSLTGEISQIHSYVRRSYISCHQSQANTSLLADLAGLLAGLQPLLSQCNLKNVWNIQKDDSFQISSFKSYQSGYVLLMWVFILLFHLFNFKFINCYFVFIKCLCSFQLSDVTHSLQPEPGFQSPRKTPTLSKFSSVQAASVIAVSADITTTTTPCVSTTPKKSALSAFLASSATTPRHSSMKPTIIEMSAAKRRKYIEWRKPE